MKASILGVADLHKRDTDFTDIKGYTKASDAIQLDIIDFIKKREITHMLSFGDWYDKGYRSINRTKNDDNLDRDISNAVNGNAYICLGNHFHLERDSNPEMYMIQPNPKYKPLQEIYATTPVFKAVDKLIIGTVQISFFHFSKENKMYVAERDPGITYHIGIYHDDTVVPSNIREEAGYFGTTSMSYLDTIFDNVDLALVGHIHAKIGVVKIVLSSGKKLNMIIPGTLGLNSSKESLRHKEVLLPVINIDDDSKVTCKLFPFSTHMEMLRWTKSEKREVAIAEAPEVVKKTSFVPTQTLRLNEYLRAKGWGTNYELLLKEAINGALDLNQAIRILTKKEEADCGSPRDIEN